MESNEKTKLQQKLERARLLKEQNAQLTGEQAVNQVREAALRLLDRKSYSCGEINRKLQEKGYPEIAIATVIERFKEVQLLDDYAYAKALMRTRFLAKGVSGSALRAELYRKFIPEPIISEVLGELSAEELKERAYTLALAKLQSLATLPKPKQKARLYALLQRKGYSPDLTRSIVESILLDNGEEYDDKYET